MLNGGEGMLCWQHLEYSPHLFLSPLSSLCAQYQRKQPDFRDESPITPQPHYTTRHADMQGITMLPEASFPLFLAPLWTRTVPILGKARKISFSILGRCNMRNRWACITGSLSSHPRDLIWTLGDIPSPNGMAIFRNASAPKSSLPGGKNF